MNFLHKAYRNRDTFVVKPTKLFMRRATAGHLGKSTLEPIALVN